MSETQEPYVLEGSGFCVMQPTENADSQSSAQALPSDQTSSDKDA